MASRREAIIAYVVGKLGEPGKPTGLVIHRSRYRPIEPDEKAIIVYPIEEDVELASMDADVRRTLRLGLECRATGDPPDEALDPLLVWATQQMFAEPRLGGLAIWVREKKGQWAGESRFETHGRAAIQFEVAYETLQGDQEAAP